MCDYSNDPPYPKIRDCGNPSCVHSDANPEGDGD
jgi:hypothetical protein